MFGTKGSDVATEQEHRKVSNDNETQPKIKKFPALIAASSAA